MKDFQTLGLPESLLQALAAMEFSTPTPVQARAIPPALNGQDIMGSAQTGTGKTAAYAIPLLTHLINNPQSTALIMTPTRELAGQVTQAIQQMMGRKSNIKSALLIGGESMPKQFRQLQQNPRLVIGTPGRINDHLSRRTLKLNKADFLVLDETDRMLDMGFGIQIDQVIEFMPTKRQTLMFSATLPSHIVKLSNKYMNDPVRIAIGSVTTPIEKIKQEVIRTSTAEKYDVLVEQLDQRGGSIIVFVKTKHGADRMARKLAREHHSAIAIHGDLKQSRRDRVIREFREKKHRILIATDVAARGLDIPHIEHVINYDLPQCPEDYIHRIGRTARAGAEGAAACLLTGEDGAKWSAIQRLIDPNAPRGRKPAPDRNKRRFNNNKNNGKPRRSKHRGGQANAAGRNAGGGGRSSDRSASGGDRSARRSEQSNDTSRSANNNNSSGNRKPRPAGGAGGDGKSHGGGKSYAGGKPRSGGKSRPAGGAGGDGKSYAGGKPRSGGKSRPAGGGKSHAGGKPRSGGKSYAGGKPRSGGKSRTGTRATA